jgi:hypothetical protein
VVCAIAVGWNYESDEVSNDWRGIQNSELFSAVYWRAGTTVGEQLVCWKFILTTLHLLPHFFPVRFTTKLVAERVIIVAEGKLDWWV